jgi:SAM-dependent methyltransferase
VNDRPSEKLRTGPGPVATRIGRLVNNVVVRAPWLWPLMRRPVTRFFDRIAGGWDERVQIDRPERAAPLVAALDAITRAPARVLEVGTGTGRGAFLIADTYPEAEVLGIDISPEMIARAQAKVEPGQEGRVRFAVADVVNAGDLGRFDLVAMMNMPPFFEAITDVVSPGGYVAWASSFGPATPFYTSERSLRRGFEKRGMHTVSAGTAGTGTYYVAERGEA